MTGYDYRCLDDLQDDVLLIEWDIAVGCEELARFAERANQSPERVLVAPYRVYRSTPELVELSQPVWPFRRYMPDGQSTRWVTPDDATCHLFGFGMAYLPRLLVATYLRDRPGVKFDDVSFSSWHYQRAEDPEVPIAWDCPMVHLNYQLPMLD